jgi:hypothetical protein
MTIATAIGVPMTSAGTLKNLRVYPGALANSNTSVAFTVYVAAAPGWTVASTSNPNTASITTVAANGTLGGNTTVTITTATNHFTVGDTVTVNITTPTTLNCNGSGGNTFSSSVYNGNRTLTAATSTTFSYVQSNPCTAGNGNTQSAPATGSSSDLTNPTFTTTTSTRTTPTATSLTCTIGAPTTSAAAVCSDPSNTVSVNAGDLVSVVGTGGKAAETLGDIRVSLEKQ